MDAYLNPHLDVRGEADVVGSRFPSTNLKIFSDSWRLNVRFPAPQTFLWMRFITLGGWFSIHFTACGKNQIFVIPRRAARRGISLFLHLNRREIPRFARNDKINYFFRSPFSQSMALGSRRWRRRPAGGFLARWQNPVKSPAGRQRHENPISNRRPKAFLK